MRIRTTVWLAALALCSWSAQPAGAQAPCAGCTTSAPANCAAPAPAYEQVEKTILVPTMVTETRRVCDVEYRTEQRQRTFTVCRPVTETHDVQETFTVMVPERRTRIERYTVSKPVMRQVTQNYTVQVPYQEQRQGTRRVCNYVPVTQTRTVSVPETRTRTESYTVPRTVMRQVSQNYTVRVPYTETREGTRQVCRWAPVNEQRTVCVDEGHYEDQVVAAGCNGGYSAGCRGHRRRCCSAPCNTGCASPCDAPAACAPVVTQKVWVPNIVQKIVNVTVNRSQMVNEAYSYLVQLCRDETRTRTVNVCDVVNETRTREVPYTVCVAKQESYVVNKPQIVDVPYTYMVTLCRPETRTRTVNVCDVVTEEQTRNVDYTVCVPKQQTRTRQVTTVNMVQEPRTETYSVQVPYRVEKDVQVQVCKMVPKKILVNVPVAPPCAPAAPPCCR